MDPPRRPPRNDGPNGPVGPTGNKSQPTIFPMPRATRSYPQPLLLQQREGGGSTDGTETDDSEEERDEAAAIAKEEEEEDPCLFCQEKLPAIGRGVINCGHVFCFDHILKWTKTETYCPVCREKFTSITKTLEPKDIEMKRARQERLKKKMNMNELSKKQISREKKKLARYKTPKKGVYTKRIRVRHRSQKDKAAEEQRNAPHPQAPGGALHTPGAYRATVAFFPSLAVGNRQNAPPRPGVQPSQASAIHPANVVNAQTTMALARAEQRAARMRADSVNSNPSRAAGAVAHAPAATAPTPVSRMAGSAHALVTPPQAPTSPPAARSTAPAPAAIFQASAIHPANVVNAQTTMALARAEQRAARMRADSVNSNPSRAAGAVAHAPAAIAPTPVSRTAGSGVGAAREAAGRAQPPTPTTRNGSSVANDGADGPLGRSQGSVQPHLASPTRALPGERREIGVAARTANQQQEQGLQGLPGLQRLRQQLQEPPMGSLRFEPSNVGPMVATRSSARLAQRRAANERDMMNVDHGASPATGNTGGGP